MTVRLSEPGRRRSNVGARSSGGFGGKNARGEDEIEEIGTMRALWNEVMNGALFIIDFTILITFPVLSVLPLLPISRCIDVSADMVLLNVVLKSRVSAK